MLASGLRIVNYDGVFCQTVVRCGRIATSLCIHVSAPMRSTCCRHVPCCRDSTCLSLSCISCHTHSLPPPLSLAVPIPISLPGWSLSNTLPPHRHRLSSPPALNCRPAISSIDLASSNPRHSPASSHQPSPPPPPPPPPQPPPQPSASSPLDRAAVLPQSPPTQHSSPNGTSPRPPEKECHSSLLLYPHATPASDIHRLKCRRPERRPTVGSLLPSTLPSRVTRHYRYRYRRRLHLIYPTHQVTRTCRRSHHIIAVTAVDIIIIIVTTNPVVVAAAAACRNRCRCRARSLPALGSCG